VIEKTEAMGFERNTPKLGCFARGYMDRHNG
jgi:hypothetical protein